ncbi:MAG: Xaa-Pro dipeptidyl-peptidase [Planctomycetota bacterium]
MRPFLLPFLPGLLALAPSAQRAVPVFEDGRAQVVEAFRDPAAWIQHDLWVETEFDSDGDGRRDRMHVDVTRPGQTRSQGLRVPVIYQTSPYYSGTSTTDRAFFWNPAHALGATPPKRVDPPPVETRFARPLMSTELVETWVPRGFAVVHSASPGTGLSDGCPTVGGANESLAPKAVIDWLCGRAKGFTEREGDDEVRADWCTGKVGMTGVSYNGTLPLAAATTGVEGLEAIVPVAANTSYYHYYRSNGLVRHPGGWMGEDIDVLFNFIHSGDLEHREHCECEVRDKILAAGLDRVSGDWNDFWASRDYQTQLDGVRAATLVVHGFNDWNVMPSHGVRVYEALQARGVPAMAYFHQGGHTQPEILELMNRWFTRYLFGVENGVEDDPRAWIIREGARGAAATAYADYPHPDARFVTLRPAADGTLGLAPGAGRASFIDDSAMTGAELARAATSPHRLLFKTAPLAEPLHISGTPRLTVRLASSAPAANLTVWLVSLPWTDSRRTTDDLVTRGWADPQNRDSLSESSPLVPGEFVDVTFDLEPDDQILAVGAELGLMIFASDRDFTLWPPAGTELTVDLAGTSLHLPVVGGAAPFAPTPADAR